MLCSDVKKKNGKNDFYFRLMYYYSLGNKVSVYCQLDGVV